MERKYPGRRATLAQRILLCATSRLFVWEAWLGLAEAKGVLLPLESCHTIWVIAPDSWGL